MELKCTIATTRSHPSMFAVALIPVPLPMGVDKLHPASNPFAVIAANDNFEGQWGWVHLSADEKDLIGTQLLNAHKPSAWYWCLLEWEV